MSIEVLQGRVFCHWIQRELQWEDKNDREKRYLRNQMDCDNSDTTLADVQKSLFDY